MGLAYEDAGVFKDRKWQCFCCGKNFNDYETYAAHVKDEHEQGREWLECPDCKAPVRDMKMHYKAKHPARVMPSGLQLRVIVWKDFRPGKDGKPKAKVRKFNARRGTFVSKKCGREFEYKSGLEEEFLNLLEEDTDVETFAYEPFKVPYFWKGEWHNYIPDIRVNYIDGSTELWELKPANQTGPEYEQNQCKWAAANNFCSNIGWDFVVLTEVGLGKYKTKIKKQYDALLRAVRRLDESSGREPDPAPDELSD
jgi:hypothetical protein